MRKVLEGVPPLGYQDCECTFTGSIYSTLKYLGKDVSHESIMGLTGSAFKLYWNKSWCPSNGSYTGGHETVFGYYGLNVMSTGFTMDIKKRASWPDMIKESIDSGYPVISSGIVGPPENIVITGYDNDKVIGLSYFYIYGKYFEKADWLKDCYSLYLIVGEPEEDKEDYVRKSIQRAISLARTPEREDGEAFSGLRAYDGWADALLDDGNFEDGSEDNVKFKNLVNKNVTLSNLVASRNAGVKYLKDISGIVDGTQALPHYIQEIEALNRCMELVPWDFDPVEVQETILNRTTREELAHLLRKAKEEDEKAIAELEKL